MKLLCTKRSPYARKIRVMAMEKKIPLELLEEDLTNKSSFLLETNPLGKIPALILDNGQTIVDSPVICEYLESIQPQPVLIPPQKDKRFYVLHWAAVADGLMDVTVAAYMEKVRHPQDPNEAFIKAQEETVLRTLGICEKNIDGLKEFTMATIALACAIGYINFRMPHLNPQNKFPNLAKWFEEFDKRPSMMETKPVI